MSPNNDRRNDEALGFLREMVDAVKAGQPEEGDYAAARRKLLRKLKTDKKESLIMNTLRRTTQARLRWVAVTAVAALLVALLVTFIPSGGTPGQVYAAVVEQLRNALTVSFNAAWYFDENEPPTLLAIAYREPGMQRIEMTHEGSRMIQLLDTNQGRGLILMPETKTYLDMDLESIPSVERQRLQLIELTTREMKSLPAQADEVLGEQVVEGRRVQGFRVDGSTLWIDVETGELAFVDKQMGGTRMVLSDFRIDPNDLDDSAFSTTPPEGYVSASREAIAYDISNPGERDLLEYLQTVASLTKDRRFPATVNPLEILSLEKEGRLEEIEDTTPEEEEKAKQAFTRACQKVVMFVMTMKPGNDWHYAGKGVQLGDSETPVAWWKPEGSTTYRVVWGDLSASNVAAEQLPPVRSNEQ